MISLSYSPQIKNLARRGTSCTWVTTVQCSGVSGGGEGSWGLTTTQQRNTSCHVVLSSLPGLTWQPNGVRKMKPLCFIFVVFLLRSSYSKLSEQSKLFITGGLIWFKRVFSEDWECAGYEDDHLARHFLCDGFAQCEDGSDEAGGCKGPFTDDVLL